MKKILLLIFISRSLLSYSQETKPKLVVGIVVDQMRQEYLYRFESKFGEGGFKRLVGKGFMLTNAHYNYVPTYTGPGHASVYSGATPSVHGIIGNDWWDKGIKKSVNCVEDDRHKPVGNPEGNGDVETFNGLKLADSYLNQIWNTVLPITQYIESSQDESPYERKLQGKEKPVFPYNLKELRKTNGDFDLLAATPFGDDLLTEFAKASILGEQMGKDADTDFLAISFSCPDIVGHAMGPNSIEVEDTYIRLDKNIEDLLKTLDKEVGENNYVVFLTADHAVAEVPQYLKDNRIPAGNFAVSSLEVNLNDFLQKYFPGKKIIEKISNDQIFLNQDLFAGDPKSAGIDLLIATELITNYLQSVEGVAQVFSKAVLKQGAYNETGIKGMMVRGFNFKRSGDIAYQLEPHWISGGGAQGTTHGSAYSYDTHVPILFYGKGIKQGASSSYHAITDIAPTLSVLLKIKFPSGCTGQPISEILD